ncbi:MAG: hypothetical protein U1E90_04240 [Burkholderiaceae bacterium]
MFGLATVTLTVGMNVAPQLYRRLAPATLALGCGLTSGLGLVLAASASGFVQFALGYGVLFGPGAGVLFIVAQQAVNLSVVQRRGLANGYVVSLDPLGAMPVAPVFGRSDGLRGTAHARGPRRRGAGGVRDRGGPAAGRAHRDARRALRAAGRWGP